MKKILRGAVLTFIVLCVLIAAAAFTAKSTTESGLLRLRKEIVDAGDYLDIEDYPLPEVQEKENAYSHLMSVGNELESAQSEIEAAKLDKVYDTKEKISLSENESQALNQILNQYSSLNEQLFLASECSGFRSEFDPQDGFAAELPHLMNLRLACRFLSFAAITKANQGEGDTALRNCEAIIKLSLLADSEPLLVGYLVGIACQSIAMDAAYQTLSVCEVSKDAIQSFLVSLNAIQPYQSLADALKAERAIAVMTFDQLREGDAQEALAGNAGGLGQLGNNWLTEAYLNDDEAVYHQIMSEQLELLNAPKSVRDTKIQETLDRLTDSGFRYAISKMVLPALAPVADAADRAEALKRCMRIIMLGQQSDAGNLEELDLPETLLEDPFSQKSLICLTGEHPWSVYSVGANLVDDSGSLKPIEGGSQPLDLGFVKISGLKPKADN